jgi:signal transduction histidine kinase
MRRSYNQDPFEGSHMRSSVARRVGRVERDVQAIGALTQAVLDGDDLEQLLGRIAREARDLADAVSGVVVTVAQDTELMTFRAVDGLTVGPLRLGHVMPVAGTLTELALARGENLVVDRMEEMPAAGRVFAAAIGVGPLVAAPLAFIGPARGVLLVARRDWSPPFRRTDVSLISTFAAQAASAVELVDLRVAEADMAARAESDRIAGDLHDGVIRALRDLHAGVRALVPAADSLLAERILGVSQQLDEAIATIASAVLELRATPASDPDAAVSAEGDGNRRPMSLPTPRGVRLGGRGSAATIAVMGDLARAAARETRTGDVLDSLVREVVARSSAQLALIGTLTADETAILVRCRAGVEVPGRLVGDRIPIRETVAGEAIRQGRVLVSSSAAALATGMSPEVAGLLGPMVAVPLHIRGRRFGAMTIARTPGSAPFSRSEIALIEAYGVQAAIALEFERVRGELRRGSVSSERDRIGRDLHQRVVQHLFGVAFGLQALESTVQDHVVRTSLQGMVEGLDRIIRDLRRLVFGLGPGPGPEAPEDQVRALAADNARLQAEISSQLAELRASRVRIIAAGDAERKRVERDLHDGAQQRLVSLMLALRLARSRLGDDLDPSAALSLDQASSDAKAALSELRELARGIHPQVLTEAGLGAAVESLAARSSIDIRVEIGDARFSPAIEGAAYFTISEALANVAKYARASRAFVRASRLDHQLIVEVADDGIGGADPSVGTGLRGLSDRLESVNGSLEIRSPLGEGTKLVARIPVPVAGA